MRSRYSAYVLGLHDYVRDTWHPSTRPPALEPDPPGLKWLGLDVRSHRVLDANRAEVDFVSPTTITEPDAPVEVLASFRVDVGGTPMDVTRGAQW